MSPGLATYAEGSGLDIARPKKVAPCRNPAFDADKQGMHDNDVNLVDGDTYMSRSTLLTAPAR